MNYKASRSVSGIMLILTAPGAVVAGYYGAAAAAGNNNIRMVY